MSFYAILKTERMKQRRSRILLLLLIPVVIMWLPGILNAHMNFKMEAIGISPENNFLIQGYMGMAWFMIPASLIICTVLLTQTERSDRGIVKMLSLPVSTAGLCLAKFLMICFLEAVQMVMIIAAYYISAAIASKTQSYDFLLPLLHIIRITVCLYLAAIPMAAVFWLIAVLIRTPIFSLGIGLASIVPSVLMINTKLWFAYPMCYPFYVLMTEYGKAANNFTTTVNLIPLLPAALAITLCSLLLSCFFYGYDERR